MSESIEKYIEIFWLTCHWPIKIVCFTSFLERDRDFILRKKRENRLKEEEKLAQATQVWSDEILPNWNNMYVFSFNTRIVYIELKFLIRDDGNWLTLFSPSFAGRIPGRHVISGGTDFRPASVGKFGRCPWGMSWIYRKTNTSNVWRSTSILDSLCSVPVQDLSICLYILPQNATSPKNEPRPFCR